MPRQIYLGNTAFSTVYLGSSSLDSIYIGSTKIYGEDPLPTNTITFDSSNGNVSVTSSRPLIQYKTVVLYTTLPMTSCTVSPSSVSGVYRYVTATMASNNLSCSFSYTCRFPIDGTTATITYTVVTAAGTQTVTRTASTNLPIN